MNTTVKFIILYLIPVFTIIGTYGTYMLGYGTSAENLISFSFFLAVIGLITSFYLTVKLVSKFLGNKIIYSGVIFTVLACILEFISFSFFIFFFKSELAL